MSAEIDESVAPLEAGFQSLFYWNTSNEYFEVRVEGIAYEFQSLFYWNTSNE